MKKFKIIANLVLIIIFLFSLYKIGYKYISDKKANDIYLDLQNIKEELLDTNEDENSLEEVLDLSYLNEDYRGWITIENTNIDYPIIQGEDNEYYLHKDINKEYLEAGSIILDYRNNKFNDKNTIIYGHSMKNNTMFGQLKYFKNSDFFYDNKYISIISTEGETLRYEIFSVYTTDINDNYIVTSFNSTEEYRNFLDEICSKSLFEVNIDISTDDRIITLSTCSYEYENARTVIHGKLIE